MNTAKNEIEVYIEPTPNPNALKFVANKTVKIDGKSSFKQPEDCEQIPLAFELFKLRGVDQVHFFGNVITVSKFAFEDWEGLEDTVIAVIKQYLPTHAPDYVEASTVKTVDRSNLTPELQQIESILDRTIRPGLQGDGGDLETVSLENNVLIIKYQGACGTCPSSQMGTLEAIKAILRDEFNPHIEVFAVPG